MLLTLLPQISNSSQWFKQVLKHATNTPSNQMVVHEGLKGFKFTAIERIIHYITSIQIRWRIRIVCKVKTMHPSPPHHKIQQSINFVLTKQAPKNQWKHISFFFPKYYMILLYSIPNHLNNRKPIRMTTNYSYRFRRTRTAYFDRSSCFETLPSVMVLALTPNDSYGCSAATFAESGGLAAAAMNDEPGGERIHSEEGKDEFPDWTAAVQRLQLRSLLSLSLSLADCDPQRPQFST